MRGNGLNMALPLNPSQLHRPLPNAVEWTVKEEYVEANHLIDAGIVRVCFAKPMVMTNVLYVCSVQNVIKTIFGMLTHFMRDARNTIALTCRLTGCDKTLLSIQAVNHTLVT
jgi:hypothetical protein